MRSFPKLSLWPKGAFKVWNCAVLWFGFCNVSGLGLLASNMKRLGYPFDCNVNITRCLSLILSNFNVGTFFGPINQ